MEHDWIRLSFVPSPVNCRCASPAQVEASKRMFREMVVASVDRLLRSQGIEVREDDPR